MASAIREAGREAAFAGMANADQYPSPATRVLDARFSPRASPPAATFRGPSSQRPPSLAPALGCSAPEMVRLGRVMRSRPWACR